MVTKSAKDAKTKTPGDADAKRKKNVPSAGDTIPTKRGQGGETHQTAPDNALPLTTNQGIPVSDNQNSLKAGPRGPTLLEDFVLREKIFHFDHERIPERIVHARGSAAHGYFELTESLADITKADFLQRVGEQTRVFARFSTVAGGAGSVDLPRDVRGFAVKFYTNEGNYDLVGNNIPVFFIQDAMKFPDLVHAVKMEPDRGFPQAASAHDTFWDFISLMPESMHMIMWAMSDRAIPRSLRMIEGFGVNTFRMINAEGDVHFVKFHWRPKIGMQSVVWDEAMKISGADPDYHRRDLWQSIADGDFPEWEFGVQVLTQEEADAFEFDILDATKLIPEERHPIRIVGKMVLNRNPDNFFAETEQVAFCPANIVPGIDVSDDPLLQGRLFSYLDTQLKRLGSPNFHEIPINRPVCPFQNHQRDGHMRMQVVKGRVAYEPNSLGPDTPRETPTRGFTTAAEADIAPKSRLRAETFADHYSQARLFFRSQTPVEQDHIAAALIFELSKVETMAIRERMVGHLRVIDETLANRVADGLGIALPPAAKPAVAAVDLEPSPALSILAKAKNTLEGRVIGCLVSDGADGALIKALQTEAKAVGAKVKLIAPTIGRINTADGKPLAADFIIDGGPSILFDAVAVMISEEAAEILVNDAPSQNFVRDAFAHLKFLAFNEPGEALLTAAGITAAKRDAGVIATDAAKDIKTFIEAARALRLWQREKSVKRPV